MTQQILKYWYELEFFNPCWPVKPGNDKNLLKSELPWRQSQSDANVRMSYDLYFGKIRARDLIAWMFESLSLCYESKAVEKDSSLTCLFALKVDENGRYVPASFALSSFAWAVSKLVEAKSFDAELDISVLEKMQQEFDQRLTEQCAATDSKPLSSTELKKVYDEVMRATKLDETLCEYVVWSREKKQYSKNREFPPLDSATELMQSFYLTDLEKVREKPTSSVKSYVEAMLSEENHVLRKHIDSDTETMESWLAAGNYPLGAWPSKYSPSLMQQIGINLAISDEQSIFSINGPPGTGKTTLLKEIIVSNIINRAILMAKYAEPDQAFQERRFQNPPDQYNQKYFKLCDSLSAYGIIVASNNNAAVENISAELPKLIKEDRTGRFSKVNPEEPQDTYFSDVASKLLDEPAWGLISAKLGKRSNLKKLQEQFRKDEDKVSLMAYYDQPKPDWTAACKGFRESLDAVNEMRKSIEMAQIKLKELNRFKAQVDQEKAQTESLENEYNRQVEKLSESQEYLEALIRRQEVTEQNAEMIYKKISWWKRLLQRWIKKDVLLNAWRAENEKAQSLLIDITQQRSIHQKQQENTNQSKKEWQCSQDRVQQMQERLGRFDSEVASFRTLFGANWADEVFWQNITQNERSQTACPWTHPEYDRMREELFYQALMLNKAFVLSSDCVRKNLYRLSSMWDGKFSDADRKNAYGHLLNTLQLVIPVISTTFASVQSFLNGIHENELGVLVIDEAGQATPQSALGAIWRARKTIVVGDPLQVEPIVTIPEELSKRFADENEIPPIYRLSELSVQMLADHQNKYGGTQSINGEELWLGCPLVVHRRCIDPMFRISNQVAYNGRMFLKTNGPDPTRKFLLSQSVWFDCKGAELGNKDHSVQQQTQMVKELFKQAISVYSGLPDLYIITPFTSVEAKIKDALRRVIKEQIPGLHVDEIRKWLDDNCGTIHTFQGKEATEVLLVLGCDAQSGQGAARWVGKKPNIINVAVSRAKFRLGVIGDYELWNKIPYVKTACQCLKRTTFDIG